MNAHLYIIRSSLQTSRDATIYIQLAQASVKFHCGLGAHPSNPRRTVADCIVGQHTGYKIEQYQTTMDHPNLSNIGRSLEPGRQQRELASTARRAQRVPGRVEDQFLTGWDGPEKVLLDLVGKKYLHTIFNHSMSNGRKHFYNSSIFTSMQYFLSLDWYIASFHSYPGSIFIFFFIYYRK